ncbi:LYR motif-containing protein 2-like [Dromiciops gliroides]|uniref:LYR motif-containing protein 2-like n=1 Tax=Dromiciops gliroides TaxID=33562 RepID=UPI001CC55071|nr:LYR motif-containing protein 2-like [Dromiciops gliroides]
MPLIYNNLIPEVLIPGVHMSLTIGKLLFLSCALSPGHKRKGVEAIQVWLSGLSSTRLPPVALTLKQFMRRQQVLLLYRKILQAISQVPNEYDCKYLQNWAREEFQRNKSATEEDTIQMMITQGNLQLKELEKTLNLAKA